MTATAAHSSPTPQFAHAVILGYGLIGASLAMAMREQGIATRISAWDKNVASLAEGREQSILDETGNSQTALETMLSGADFICFALPPQRILEVAQSIRHLIPAHALVMDVASVKQPIAEGLRAILPYPGRYIPAHPIAGAAGSGAGHAAADIFSRRAVMLSPEMGVEITDPALMAARTFWESLGAQVTLIPAEAHDAIYAYVSHLPQVMAFAAGHALLSRYPRAQIAQGDILPRFLRLNASSAELWTEIFMLNVQPFAAALETAIAFARHFLQELSEGCEKDAAPTAEAMPSEVATLFSRIAASCVVMSVFQLERNAKMKVARFAGTGFADVCAPAIESPEPEFERISAVWQPIANLLEETIGTLELVLQTLRMSQNELLQSTLETLRHPVEAVQ